MAHDVTLSTTTTKSRAIPVVSLRTADGTLSEMVLRKSEGRSIFIAMSADGVPREVARIDIGDREYLPYSADNNLFTHDVVLLPSAVAEFGEPEDVLRAVRAFIHRYVDVSEAFEEVAAHYVLMTWVYDSFNELPYLRVRGGYGKGKSRFLQTIGSLCYKPIFASGASTVSPLFRLMDEIRGTLVIDEADFFASDERAEIVKILNNGNARGFPVLRSDVTPSREFRPRAFAIFGPKVIATRHSFQDPALESRCLAEVFDSRPVRADVPISLPAAFHEEALLLRNQLLAYRFRQNGNVVSISSEEIRDLPPRRRQILAPLLAVAVTPDARKRLCAFARGESSGNAPEDVAVAHVLSTVQNLLQQSAPVTLSAVADRFNAAWSGVYGSVATPRWIGSVLRKVGITAAKSNGIYRINPSGYPRLRQLIAEHCGGDNGDERDVAGGVAGATASTADASRADVSLDPGESPMSPMS